MTTYKPGHSQTIDQLASSLFENRHSKDRGFTLLLGASSSRTSGCPDWQTLANLLSTELDTEAQRRNDPINPMAPFESIPPEENTWRALRTHYARQRPSLGYRHLVQLIAHDYFPIILVTNWDTALEEALSRVLCPHEFRVLVRGEVPDQVILHHIKQKLNRVTIIKLQGDLGTRILFPRAIELVPTDELTIELRRLLDDNRIVIGRSACDDHIFNCLGIPYLSLDEEDIGSNCNFDDFFIALNLSVHRRESEAKDSEKMQIEAAILEKHDQARGYFSYHALAEAIGRFSQKALACNPDLILFVYDPAAPGGVELQKHMQSHLGNTLIDLIEVSGEGNNRVFHRKAKVNSHDQVDLDQRNILILDEVTFSGNTLAIARQEVQKWYPNATVKVGVFLISQYLIENLQPHHPLRDIFYEAATDRHELLFPWGLTQTTGNLRRRFISIDGSRDIEIVKRPWGTIEVLTEEEVCSVRLLTIEAGSKLSFQRHLCRDELFVALDDDIGLEISAEEPVQPFSVTDPKIKAILLESGDYILIPRGIWHRSKSSKYRVRLLEVAFGTYDQVNDIERLDDIFGRVGEDGAH